VDRDLRNGLFPEIPKSHERTTMKKQINPSIKAHLLWSALVLLSLLAICAIPFALAQSRGRGTNNRSVANRSDEAQLRINKDGAFGMPAFSILPRTPDVVLYDQLNNPGSQSTNSQSVFNDQAADDFVVPSGQTWNITEVDVQGVYFDCSNPCGPADSFNFYFYRDFGGLPGPILLGIGGTSYVNNSGVFQIPVSPSQLVLGPGRYWVSVQSTRKSARAWDLIVVSASSIAHLATWPEASL